MAGSSASLSHSMMGGILTFLLMNEDGDAGFVVPVLAVAALTAAAFEAAVLEVDGASQSG